VVGHSLGALLSLQLAVQYPDLVRGVVLISLPLFATEAQARRPLARGSAMARLQIDHPCLARWFCWGVCNARPLMRSLMPLLERSVPPAVARAAADHSWESASRTVDGVILHTRPAALLDQLPAERVLFIHAADDRTAPISAVQSYARTGPGTTLVVFPTGGHHPYLRHQVADCAVIARFVDDRPA
jgi:pimeloyl-ACP methyl ester carboxylesterase